MWCGSVGRGHREVGEGDLLTSRVDHDDKQGSEAVNGDDAGAEALGQLLACFPSSLSFPEGRIDRILQSARQKQADEPPLLSPPHVQRA